MSPRELCGDLGFLLQAVDDLLRCGICFDYFSIAMMIPQCSHNCKYGGRSTIPSRAARAVWKFLALAVLAPSCCRLS